MVWAGGREGGFERAGKRHFEMSLEKGKLLLRRIFSRRGDGEEVFFEEKSLSVRERAVPP